ncbi:kinase-like domain, phloem protein 2-like protein [Tanacetum coccineum]
MLSLGSMYTASLVFKFRNQHNVDLENLELTTTKWKTEQLSISSTHNAQKTTGDWYKIKMWNFINNGMNADFDIVLEELTYTEHPDTSEQVLMIQEIDFEPIEMHEEIERFRSFWISKDDEYLGKKLPTGFQDCIEMADNHLDDTNQRELYLRFCEGFLGNNGRLWFSLCKSTGFPTNQNKYITRFSEVKKLHDTSSFCFKCKLESPMFSPEYTYACYLVFKLEDNHILHDEIRLFKLACKTDEISQGTLCVHFNLSSMNIPTIEPKNEYGLDDSSNKPRSEGLRMPKYHMEHLVDSKMEERKDGWMEIITLLNEKPTLWIPKGLKHETINASQGQLSSHRVKPI